MSLDGVEELEERLVAFLSAYDEALATGSPSAPPAGTLPLDVQPRAERALHCLHLLEAKWPRGTPSVGTPVPFPWVDGFFPDAQATRWLGRYQVLRLLGAGGHGLVYLAWDPLLRREVAVKVPRPDVFLTADARKRWLREARTTAGLDHPNLITVHEAGEMGPLIYLVSTYCPGPTLATWLSQRPEPVPARAAAALLADLADALAYLHGRGILHRDLKPGNILLQESEVRGQESEVKEDRASSPSTSDLCPKITDFGLAQNQEQTRLTRTGAAVGTPQYMAPEQAEGHNDAVGPATDVYALGVILYEVLTGRPPFGGQTALDTLRRVVAEEPIPPRRLRSDVPADLQMICLKCLRKEPWQRYPTAASLADDLRRFLAGEPVYARPLSPWRRGARWVRRRPTAAALIAVSATALLALLCGSLVYSARLQGHSTELENTNRALAATTAREREQRALAEERAALLRQDAYADRFVLARLAWEKGQFGQAVELLDSLRPGPREKDLRGFAWHYLKGRCHPLGAVWRGHQRAPHVLAVSPDGCTVATGGYDHTVRLWDVATGQTRAVLRDLPGGASDVAFSPDGGALALACSIAETVCVWDVAAARERSRWPLKGHPASLAFSPDGRHVTVVVPGTAGRWEADTGKLVERFPAPGGALEVGTISEDGQICAAGYADGTVQVWNLRVERERFVLHGHQGAVHGLAFAPNGRMLASAGEDQTVRLWDASTGTARATLQGHRHPVSGLAFSPDGRTLASAADGEELPDTGGTAVRLWDVATGRLRAEFDRHLGRVNHLAFIPGSTLLVLTCKDKTVKLLDTGTGPATAELPGHTPKETWALAFSPDGRTLASAGDDHHVRLWDARGGQERAVLRGHAALVTAVAFSPDGRWLASGSFDCTVKVWDAATGELRSTFTSPTDKVRCVAFSPDGQLVAAGGRDLTVRVWRFDTGEELPPRTGHWKTVRAVAFAPKGDLLASSSEDGTLRLWDAATGELRASLDGTDEMGCLAFAPDGGTFVTGNRGGFVQLWDLASRKVTASLRGHGGEVWAVAFSPDGRTLASAGGDRTVRLWQAAPGAELLTLTGHTTRVNAVAFSPDGKTVASGSHDGGIRLWRGSE